MHFTGILTLAFAIAGAAAVPLNKGPVTAAPRTTLMTITTKTSSGPKSTTTIFALRDGQTNLTDTEADDESPLFPPAPASVWLPYTTVRPGPGGPDSVLLIYVDDQELAGFASSVSIALPPPATTIWAARDGRTYLQDTAADDLPGRPLFPPAPTSASLPFTTRHFGPHGYPYEVLLIYTDDETLVQNAGQVRPSKVMIPREAAAEETVYLLKDGNPDLDAASDPGLEQKEHNPSDNKKEMFEYPAAPENVKFPFTTTRAGAAGSTDVTLVYIEDESQF